MDIVDLFKNLSFGAAAAACFFIAFRWYAVNILKPREDYRLKADSEQHSENVNLVRELRQLLPKQEAQLERIVEFQGQLASANESHSSALESQGRALETVATQTTGVMAAVNAQTLSLQSHRERLEANQKAQLEAFQNIADRRYVPKKPDTGERRRGDNHA